MTLRVRGKPREGVSISSGVSCFLHLSPVAHLLLFDHAHDDDDDDDDDEVQTDRRLRGHSPPQQIRTLHCLAPGLRRSCSAVHACGLCDSVAVVLLVACDDYPHHDDDDGDDAAAAEDEDEDEDGKDEIDGGGDGVDGDYLHVCHDANGQVQRDETVGTILWNGALLWRLALWIDAMFRVHACLR